MFHTADNVTSVQFDENGSILATGDRGGRIVVFKYAGTSKQVVSHIPIVLMNEMFTFCE